MRNEGLINEKEIRKAILQLKPNNQLFEIRILQGKKTLSGYFKDVNVLLSAFDTVDLRKSNVYLTINKIKEECYSREQNNHFVLSASTTSDNDVESYDWLFIDLDPERMTGISSSKAELDEAVQLSKKIITFLTSIGFENPIRALSGNGIHLLYKIDLPNTLENKELVKNCLETLSMLFDNEHVKVDVTTHNQSRICKLYGTLAQKGANTEDRPHRLSTLLDDVREVNVTDKAYLEKLVAQLPRVPEQPKKYNNYNPQEFDLETFMSIHGLDYVENNGTGCKIYSLRNCPFDHNHKNGDSKIFHYSNGAIAFKCHHNSCSHYKWQDVRLMFEPDAYEYNDIDKRIEEGWKEHNRNYPVRKVAENFVETEANTNVVDPAWLNAQMLLDCKEPDVEYIRSGINRIDLLMHGLGKTKTSLISGLRGSAKSTWIGQIILTALNDNHNVICYSGELSKKNFLKWIMNQASGKHIVQKSQTYGDFYDTPYYIKQKIASWMGDRFWLYNNDYGNNYAEFFNKLKAQIINSKADLVILDNLMTIDLTKLHNDKYEAQTQFVLSLHRLAEQTHTHIMFVAHPRKANGFLRLDDVAGSGNLTNDVDNAFIVHRVNNDFVRLTKEMFKWKDDNVIYSATNCIEIAKDREEGHIDEFIPLWFEVSTKRLKNSPEENIIYGWDKDESISIGFNNPFEV